MAFGSKTTAARRKNAATVSAIEDLSFPFESLSEIAELESWRKEVNRPNYHIHKWWAQRLGSVFRAILIAAFSPSGTDVLSAFYQRRKPSKKIVFDPFMGSGTTLGESIKLGFRAIGKDINPVSHFLVKNALAAHSRDAILEEFAKIEADTAPMIRRFYHANLGDQIADVLYYFWVKTVPCPQCSSSVDLFSRLIFSQNAYPKRVPQAKAICPDCGEVNDVLHDDTSAICKCCGGSFNPQQGPARGQSAHCPNCDNVFPIAKTIKASGEQPRHRMYAKMVLLNDGQKQYQRITETDRTMFAEAERQLKKRANAFPFVRIEPGYNTNQAINYNYTHWHMMFNARQLLCLSILSDRIRQIEDSVTRDLFACLLSGCLEFNNMFASFKGEGTGAVRHMFSHHILKPERTPLEANLWGTPKSSGSFSTLFRSRILRALDYQEHPFELRPVNTAARISSEKVFDTSLPIEVDVAESFAEFANGKQAYIAYGSSCHTDIPDKTIHAVVTDPPFFDNVHYSQLADFFHVWQRHILGNDGPRDAATTRNESEVQQSDPNVFSEKLGAVWKECNRILKNDGMLIFSYHHSRPEGWKCVLDSLTAAGFNIRAVHPIKAEMSVAMPKMQAKEPIDYDIIIVCRKSLTSQKRLPLPFDVIFEQAIADASHQIKRLKKSRRPLSRNDARIILMAQVIRHLSNQPVTIIDPISVYQKEIESGIDSLYSLGSSSG